jgi:hypothetical protein
MVNTARIPITNYHLRGDYTGRLLVGPQKQPMNVILDTGSSALALDGHKYRPHLADGDKATDLAQSDSYGDNSSWTGAVISTTVTAGEGAGQVTLADANVSVAYEESADMFSGCDGILGLAYAPLDDAYRMPTLTWPKKYSAFQVRQGKRIDIKPYLTQLASERLIFDKVSFLTKRSYTHVGSGGIDDPLNQGWMIIGGGEEATDLYTGAFSTVKVLADEWYNTNLRAVVVGTSDPIELPARGLKGMPSNSIVDSGTNSLNLGVQLLNAMFQKFTADQQTLLKAAVFHNRLIDMADLDLPAWPDITFVMQGETKTQDVALKVVPGDYWQINAPKVGAALPAITVGDDGFAILGLPLMNGYFTVFDGEADKGRGAIRFAKSNR